jgi:hypothetical protein
MKQLFKTAALTAIATLVLSSCSEDSPSSAKGETAAKEVKKDDFQAIGLSEEDRVKIDNRLSALLSDQTAGDYAASVEHYFPKIYGSETDKAKLAEALASQRSFGIEQAFTDFELLWVSPFYQETGYEVCFAMYQVKHSITLTGQMAEKFNAYEVNIKDTYGRQYYTKDASNNTYLIDGPIKFFFFKTDAGDVYILNEEVLRSGLATTLFQTFNLQDMKQFETKARKHLGV